MHRKTSLTLIAIGLVIVIGALNIYLTSNKTEIARQMGDEKAHHANKAKKNNLNINITGKNVTVAVIDSGVNSYHPYIKNNIIEGYNFTNNSYDVADTLGHGTKIAGIIAGKLGLAKECKIMPLKVVDDENNVKPESVANAIKLSVQKSVDVINISLEFEDENKEIEEALKLAYYSNIPIIVSAGNNGTSVAYPASSVYAIGVSAIDINDKLWKEANFGSEILFTALGVDVSVINPNSELILKGTGSSFSSAYITGLVALIKSKNNKSDINQIKIILKKSSKVEYSLNGYYIPDLSLLLKILEGNKQ